MADEEVRDGDAWGIGWLASNVRCHREFVVSGVLLILRGVNQPSQELRVWSVEVVTVPVVGER